MGLPAIEEYIEQKIPVEPITAELLVAKPRTPMPALEGHERISDMFEDSPRNNPRNQKGGPGKSRPRRGKSGAGVSAPGSKRSEGSDRPRRERSGPRPDRSPERKRTEHKSSGDRRERQPKPNTPPTSSAKPGLFSKIVSSVRSLFEPKKS